MRPITLTIYPNNGTAETPASSLSVEGFAVQLGRLSWDLDGDDLLKFKPGSFTFKLADPDEAIWNWLAANAATTGKRYSPWVELKVNGERRFLGILDLASLRRDHRERYLEAASEDWSVQLRDLVLEGSLWERPRPKIISERPGSGPYLGSPFFNFATWKADQILFHLISMPLQVGDFLTFDATGEAKYKIVEIQERTEAVRTIVVTEPGIPWAQDDIQGSFIRLSSSLSETAYYSVTATIESGATAIPLDTVDYLVQGDSLQTVDGSSFEIAEIDAERKEIIPVEPIQATILDGDKLYLTEDSKKQLVYEPATTLIQRAAMPYAVDTTGLETVTLTRPVLAWLPMRNPAMDSDLRQICDIEPTLAETVRLIGYGGQTWDGTPEAGYASDTSTTRYVDWTSQLTAKPTRLIPDETPAIAAAAGTRNRIFTGWGYTLPQLFGSNWEAIAAVFAPSTYVWPVTTIAHDYSQFRRVVFGTLGAAESTYSEQRWSGSAWSTATTGAYPVAGWHPCSAVPMMSVTATSGPVAPQGKAILVLASNGSAWELQLIWAGSPVRFSISEARAKGARLRTTPWGTYLIGPGGYGRVKSADGVLYMVWVACQSAQAQLFSGTLAAMDAETLFCFARVSHKNDQDQELVETHLFQIHADPAEGENPLLWSEKVAPGCPRTLAVVRDPSRTGRLLGVFGGRYFQICAELPQTVERVAAQEISGGELIEHVCQLLNAVAVPGPDGVLRIISRKDPAPVALTVDQAQIGDTYASEHFYSVVRVTGAEDDLYADVAGTLLGGRALEVNSHPMIWTEGGCYALASAFVAFWGTPRRVQERLLVHANADTAPPWEGVATPWAGLNVNSEGKTWILTGWSEDLIKGEARAKLLEVI